MNHIRTASLVASLLTSLAVIPSADAFQISSGATEPCHERITIEAGERSLLPHPLVDHVVVPNSDTWHAVEDTILDDVDFDYANEREKFILISLAIGARWPDTTGHSLTSLADMREANARNANQHDHALRELDEDHEEGQIRAVEGVRRSIRARLDRAAAALDRPPGDQLITREIFIDFYGPIEVELWAPAFHLGFASHTLQDSFAHSLRDESMREILHVLNFIEAARGEHDPVRDGIAHSGAMDKCGVEVPELMQGAIDATADMYDAFASEHHEGNTKEVPAMLDRWLTHRSGCTEENDYCDSPWLDVALTEPSKPLLSCAMSSDGRSPIPAVLLLLGMLLLARAHARRIC